VTDGELEFCRAFIAGRRWRYARSQPWNPHEYTLRDAVGDALDDLDFDAFLTMIATRGYSRWFGPRVFAHLEIDDHNYFSFGGPLRAAGISNVINRKLADRVDGPRDTLSFEELGIWDPHGDPDTDLHRAKQMAGSLEVYRQDPVGWLAKSVKYREKAERRKAA
jgi:hypothetical protein